MLHEAQEIIAVEDGWHSRTELTNEVREPILWSRLSHAHAAEILQSGRRIWKPLFASV